MLEFIPSRHFCGFFSVDPNRILLQLYIFCVMSPKGRRDVNITEDVKIIPL